MARLARVVIPGMPHHVTQRGNRRQETFFRDDDYQAYLDLMAEWCGNGRTDQGVPRTRKNRPTFGRRRFPETLREEVGPRSQTPETRPEEPRAKIIMYAVPGTRPGTPEEAGPRPQAPETRSEEPPAKIDCVCCPWNSGGIHQNMLEIGHKGCYKCVRHDMQPARPRMAISAAIDKSWTKAIVRV